MDEQSIFIEALQKHDDLERAAFLDHVCATNPALRQRIERLLHQHQGAGCFLESPAHLVRGTMDEPTPERPGTVIGPYKLLQQIGEGGMGVVFLAEQTKPVQRKVAIKVIKPGMDSRQIIARFEAERQALALMDHVNIARVLDAGTTGGESSGSRQTSDSIGTLASSATGRPYFVMELVNGVPITKYCDDNHLTTRARLELFVPVCQAIQHAHQKGIIHRDIKPSNVMVTLYDGKPVPKVIDFGVAKATEQRLTERTLFTQHGTTVGTLEYMSPEQAEMSALGVDTRSDVYSLGVLLYELLTGSTPLTSKQVKEAAFGEILRIIKEEEPQKPSTRLSESGEALASISALRQTEPARLSKLVKGELDWIVMRTLEKDRNRRYESASAFAADVQRYLSDEPVQACPPSVRYRLHKFVRKNKAVLMAAALVVAALAIGTVVSTWEAVRATQAEVQAESQRELAEGSAHEALRQATEAQGAKQEAERQRNAVSQNLYYADMRIGLADWNAGNMGRLSDKLRGHVPQKGRYDIRSWEWYYLLSLCHQDERTLVDHGPYETFVDWSPDGRYVTSNTLGGQQATSVWDTTSWRLVRQLRLGEVRHFWSPDSQRLACAGRGNSGVVMWDSRTDQIQIFRGHTSTTWTVAWNPNGKQIASAGMGQTIHIWEADTGSCLRVLKFNGDDVESLAWSPDGKLLASAEVIGGLKIWDARSGQLLPIVFDGGGAMAVAWSPDGKRLALGTSHDQCRLYNTTDWSIASKWNAHAGPVQFLAWNLDGSRLASAGADHLIKLWDPTAGACVLTLRGHRNLVKSIAWEPNGHRLVSGSSDGNVKVWPIPLAPQPRSLQGHPGGIKAMAWCETGITLRSIGAADGKVILWNVVNGERLGQAQVPPGRAAQFISAGRQVAVAAPNGKEAAGLVICDARSGEQVRTISSIVTPDFWIAPDASRLAQVRKGALEKLEFVHLRQGEVRFCDHGLEEILAGSWSPDGRLLAIAGRGGESVGGYFRHTGWVLVFDAEKCERFLKLRLSTNEAEAFAVAWSPNSQQLVVGDAKGYVEVWDVQSGRKAVTAHLHTARIEALAWSPDGRRVASGCDGKTVRVWDPTSGEELITLDTGNSGVVEVQWSSDGRRLAAACSDGSIQVWDASGGYDYFHSVAYYTEQVRAQLKQATDLSEAGRTDEAIALYEQTLEECRAKLGPDHSDTLLSANALALAYCDASKTKDALALWDQILEKRKTQLGFFVPLVGSNLNSRASVANAEGRSQEAIALYRLAIRFNNDDASTHNNLAWLLATSADPKLRDPAQAVQLAQRAVELNPSAGNSWNTLGVAQFRAGHWKAAVIALEKSLELDKGGDSFDWFFLAMAHWQLNQKDEARTWYDKAVQWMDKSKPQDEELLRFRAEAAGLLGIKDKAKSEKEPVAK